MTTSPIIESGMTFGPYPDGSCFYIEKSNTYASVQDGVKMAEFLLLRQERGKPPVLWVVEAKSSTPRPEKKNDFDQFIAEVRDKLVNGFSLGWASCLKRHQMADDELPSPFKALDLSRAEVRFVLVINNHKEDWLSPIKDALQYALRPTVRIWGFSPTSVVVINDELARKYRLICPTDGE